MASVEHGIGRLCGRHARWQLLVQLVAVVADTHFKLYWRVNLTDHCRVDERSVQAEPPTTKVFLQQCNSGIIWLVMKRSLCYKRVCPSVRPSVCLSVCPSYSWITPKRFKLLKYFLRHTTEGCFYSRCQILRKTGIPLSIAKIGPVIRQISETVYDTR